MKVYKVDSIGHISKKGTRQAIYSNDLQPNGCRLATAGGDSVVRIWNIHSLLKGTDIHETAFLCALYHHAGTVTSVRWSKDGKYLASGSDDKNIFIYRYSTSPMHSSTFGMAGSSSIKKDPKPKENWMRCYTLQGHTMDILDLDWSTSHLLASASIDNTIRIWNISEASQQQHTNTSMFNTLPNSFNFASDFTPVLSPMKILYGHQSYVRGISFDPMMMYLVSCSADKVLYIWDIQTWSIIRKITDIYDHNTPQGASFTRLSWSPDGSSLCVTSTHKSLIPISMILKRDTWESIADFVGHQSDTMSCRFLPHLLHHEISTIRDSKCISESQQSHSNHDHSGNSGSSNSSSSSSSSNNNNGHLVKDNQSKDTKKKVPSCFIAVGDTQGVISIWASSRSRPILVLNDIFNGAISDISWIQLAATTKTSDSLTNGNIHINEERHTSNNQNYNDLSNVLSYDSDVTQSRTIMCASSMDGYLILVDMNNVLGTPFSTQEMESHRKNTYGNTGNPLQTKLSQDTLLSLNSSTSNNSNINMDIEVSNNPLLFSMKENLSFLQQNNGNNNTLTNTLLIMKNNVKDLSTQNDAVILHTPNLSSTMATATADKASYSVEEVLSLQTNTKSTSGKKRIQPVTIHINSSDCDVCPTLSSESIPISTRAQDIINNSSTCSNGIVSADIRNTTMEYTDNPLILSQVSDMTTADTISNHLKSSSNIISDNINGSVMTQNKRVRFESTCNITTTTEQVSQDMDMIMDTTATSIDYEDNIHTEQTTCGSIQPAPLISTFQPHLSTTTTNINTNTNTNTSTSTMKSNILLSTTASNHTINSAYTNTSIGSNHMNTMLDNRLNLNGSATSSKQSTITHSNTTTSKKKDTSSGSMNNSKSILSSSSNTSNSGRSASPVPPSVVETPINRTLSITFKDNDMICAIPYISDNIVEDRTPDMSLKKNKNTLNNTIPKNKLKEVSSNLSCKVKSSTSLNNVKVSSDDSSICILKAEILSKPNYLNHLSRYHHDTIYILTLTHSSTITLPVSSRQKQQNNMIDSIIWKSAIMGNVTCICGHLYPRPRIHAAVDNNIFSTTPYATQQPTSDLNTIDNYLFHPFLSSHNSQHMPTSSSTPSSHPPPPYISNSYMNGISNPPSHSTNINVMNNVIQNDDNDDNSMMNQDGICAIGTYDGILHIYSLACGMSLKAPMVLGMPVVCIDLIHIQDNDNDNDQVCHSNTDQSFSWFESTRNVTRTVNDKKKLSYIIEMNLLTCTADGEIRVWYLYYNTYTKTLDMSIKLKTTIRPPMQSMRMKSVSNYYTHDRKVQEYETNGKILSRKGDKITTVESSKQSRDSNTESQSIFLHNCTFNTFGIPVITLKYNTSSILNNKYRPMGGHHQAFQYDRRNDVWLRVADMRHVLSRLFSVPTIQAYTTPDNDPTHSSSYIHLHPLPSSIIPASTSSSTSQDILQTEVAFGDHFNLQAILEVTSIHNAIARECHIATTRNNNTLNNEHMSIGHNVSRSNNKEMTTSSSSSSSSSNSSMTAAERMKEWCDWITLSHIEEKLCIAMENNEDKELYRWIGEWVYYCCQKELKTRLIWFIQLLLSYIQIPSSSSEMTSSTSAAASRMNGDSSTRDIHGNTSSIYHKNGIPTSNKASKEKSYENHRKVKSLQILQYIVLPTIKTSGKLQHIYTQLKEFI